ncbi:MAG: methyl-accepting chemotaxis protein [Pseudomonadota bacterium]
MKTSEKKAPLEVFKKIKSTVGPARSGAFEILALLSVQVPDDPSDSDLDRINALAAQLNAARDMLTTGARRLLEDLDRPLPGDLVAAQDAARMVMTSFADRVSASVRDLERGAVSVPDVRAATHVAQTELRPKIDAYLVVLGAHFEHENSRNAADDRDLIKSAMQEIDNISMSINLISLNASVEAARAGEAGRGFAVIAAEIQSLSSDSKKAVDSIRQRLT